MLHWEDIININSRPNSNLTSNSNSRSNRNSTSNNNLRWNSNSTSLKLGYWKRSSYLPEQQMALVGFSN